MRISGEWKVGEIGESLCASFGGDDGRAHVAVQDLRDFQIDQVRSVQRLAGGEEKAAHMPSRGRLEENLENRGGVDDDQQLFLSARTAAAGAGRGRTGCRLESRLWISVRVGRSRAWRISRSK